MWPPDHLEDLRTLQSVTSYWAQQLPGGGELKKNKNKTKQKRKKVSCVCILPKSKFFFFFWFELDCFIEQTGRLELFLLQDSTQFNPRTLLFLFVAMGWQLSDFFWHHFSCCFSAVCIVQNLCLNLSGAGDGPSCESKKKKKREQDDVATFNVIWKLHLKIHLFQEIENGTETVTSVEKFLMKSVVMSWLETF